MPDITPPLTCDALKALVEPTPAAVCVLVTLTREPYRIHFTTYGRTAADKAEAHRLKEWVKDEVFDGAAPPPVVHESFILDAAKNKERADALIPLLRETRAALGQCAKELGVGYFNTICDRVDAALKPAEMP